MVVRFCIAPINWTNDDDPSLGGEISLEQCLTEMREAGFDGCELGNKFPKEISALSDCLSRFNLTLTTDWIGTEFTVDNAFESTLDHFARRCAFLKNFGVEALKVCEVGHCIQQTSQPIFSTWVTFSNEQWRRLIKGLHKAGEIAQDHGMYVAYHHHLGTGVQTERDIDRLMDQTDSSSVTLLPDTGHLYAAHIDPLSIFKRYGSRIRYVHLKDVRKEVFTWAKSQPVSFMDCVRAGLFTVPGDGCIEFAAIFAELKRHQYDGWLVVEAEQDPNMSPPLPLARKARELLRDHFSC